MLRKLFGAAVTLAVAAAGVKIVKDILEADEEENQEFINLDAVKEDQPEEIEIEE